jgi:hypothetical protein
MANRYELDEMAAGKHARPTVEDVSQLSDQDHIDSAQLNNLGKKSVLKVIQPPPQPQSLLTTRRETLEDGQSLDSAVPSS